MSKYKIKYFYETGDSFGRHDAEGVLEMEWSDLEKAKTALQRIRDHYDWYHEKNSYWSKKEAPEPEWHKGIEYDFSLKVELDNGNEVQFVAPWCGYFERLYSAKIMVGLEEGMEIEF